MSKWDDIAEELKKNSGGTFLKLADGEKVVGAFVGDPELSKVVWNDGKKENFDPKVHVGKKPQFRIALNFFDMESKTMKLFECAPTTFESINTVRCKYGQDKWCFELSRKGTGAKDTRYPVMPERQLTDEERSIITKTPLVTDKTGFGDDDIKF